MSYKDRQKTFCWVGKQNDQVIFDVFKLQKDYFYRYRAANEDADVVLISEIALLHAAREIIIKTTPKNRKIKASDFSFLKNVSKNRAKQFRKPRKATKRDRLLNLQKTVIYLLEIEGYSLRRTAAFLLHYHDFEISHTEILKFHKMIKAGY
ncbi:MAG TPA: hypothetical protein VEZ39_04540 [Sulfuricurvum sp.]|nr:hypothetical protein [Sulfuricurvum sp.]